MGGFGESGRWRLVYVFVFCGRVVRGVVCVCLFCFGVKVSGFEISFLFFRVDVEVLGGGDMVKGLEMILV